MHILYTCISILLISLGIVSFSFSSKKKFNQLFSALCFSSFFYIFLIYSLITQFSTFKLKLIFSFSLLTLGIFHYFLISFFKKKVSAIDYVLTGLFISFTIAVHISTTFVKNVDLIYGTNGLIQAISIQYNIIHAFLIPILIVFLIRIVTLFLKEIKAKIK